MGDSNYILEGIFRDDITIGNCCEQTDNVVHAIKISVGLAQGVYWGIAQKLPLVVQPRILC